MLLKNIIEIHFSVQFKRDFDNPLWKFWRKTVSFYNKQINNCYNLYYKLQNKPILGPFERYKLQELLDNKDPECIVLGISQLIEYNAGNDLLKHCMCRIYCEKLDSEKGLYKECYKCGNILLSNDTKIQEIIDDLKQTYLSISDGTSVLERIQKCNEHLKYLGYWMFYHPRIGSQYCNSLGMFAYCGNPFHKGREGVELIGEDKYHWYNTIYTWDWRRQRYDYPVKAEKYWKYHNKPDISGYKRQ